MSLSRYENGSWRLQLTGTDGVRRSVFLSKTTSKAAAVTFSNTVQRLLQCARLEVPFDARDQKWIVQQDGQIKKKLAKLGLVRTDQVEARQTLKAFTEQYIVRQPKETQRKLSDVARRLIAFFGDIPLHGINNADAQRFQHWLVSDQRLAENSTARRHIGYCVQIWNAAIDDELIVKNPFAQKGLKKAVKTNKERHFYVDRELAKRIFAVIPSTEYRLRFTLMRFNGFRAPSELNELRWSDIDWQNQSMTIRADKNRHQEDGGVRVSGIFPEVLPLLEEMSQARRGDAINVLPRISHKNLTKHVRNWVAAVGVDVWPQLLVNLRRSAATDAHDLYAPHVVDAWFGHCEAVSKKHYRMVTDEHYARLKSQASSLV
ncbi:tyrosine-type recombinase/integrase [Rubinisphaera sp. JC750]|uniref:tyrosine-type recombinase/integrase n=1 Tax=Rubinisphaera sp. JC750 TaxID=2898658 RepID=UPI001F288981|nr:phage integrase SAM-like domain-containing protein [Rubinisphaera sp. JC750]